MAAVTSAAEEFCPLRWGTLSQDLHPHDAGLPYALWYARTAVGWHSITRVMSWGCHTDFEALNRRRCGIGRTRVINRVTVRGISTLFSALNGTLRGGGTQRPG